MSTAQPTPGPWSIGKPPHGHCRIYAPGNNHAIARTYGPDLNGIGVCALTGPTNAADALLIAQAPAMFEVVLDIISMALAIESGECSQVDQDPFWPHIVAGAMAIATQVPGPHQWSAQ